MGGAMIDRFQGQYRFLSNFYPAIVTLGDDDYPTVEHAYQAAKSPYPRERRMIRLAATPGDAKRLGSRLLLRLGWEDLKLSIMEDLVRQKFTRHPHLRSLLLLTGHQELIEENSWGDRFWGVCRGEGENHMGKILMKVREEVRTAREEAVG